MSTLALAVSPAKVRPRVAWRLFLALAGSWLVASLAQLEIKLPFTPVPITGQTLGVLLVAASLGTGLGVISMALYLLQGAIGFPFFSGSPRRLSSGRGARPPAEQMIAYIDCHKDRYGVEPICEALPIAPSTYHDAKRRPPSARALRDEELRAEIRRVHDENFRVYEPVDPPGARSS